MPRNPINMKHREAILAHLETQPWKQSTIKKISADLGLTGSDVSRALKGAPIERERKGNVMVVKLNTK